MVSFKEFITTDLITEASNGSVIDSFISGQGKARSQHLYVTRNANGTRTLVNYSTPIAYLAKDGVMYINSRKYSVTTSKIQRWLRSAVETSDFDTAEVDERALKDKIDADYEDREETEVEKKEPDTLPGMESEEQN